MVITARFPGPGTPKQAQIITPQTLWLTADMSWYSMFAFLQILNWAFKLNNLSLFHKPCGLFQCKCELNYNYSPFFLLLHITALIIVTWLLAQNENNIMWTRTRLSNSVFTNVTPGCAPPKWPKLIADIFSPWTVPDQQNNNLRFYKLTLAWTHGVTSRQM